MNKSKVTKGISPSIRLMKKSDLDSVVDIEEKSFPDPWPRSAFEELVSQPDYGGVVAIYDDKIIGYGCFLIIAHEAHLTNLAVEEPFRRKYVARQLLERILEIADRNKCEYVLLEVRPRNTSAADFYENAGFKFLYRRPGYYRNPVEDALVMVRYSTDKKSFL